MVVHQIEHAFKTKVADLIMTPSYCSLLMHGQQDQLKLGLLGVFGQEFSVQNALLQLEVVAFSKELAEFKVVLLVYMCSGSGSCPASSQSSDSGQGLPFGPDAIVSSHAGDLLAISYWVQDM